MMLHYHWTLLFWINDVWNLLQLEESNKTLTKDVENLSKETAELNEKLKTQEEGNFFYCLKHRKKEKTLGHLCHLVLLID